MAFELLTGPSAFKRKEYISGKIREILLSGTKPEEILIISNTRKSADGFKDVIIENSGSFGQIWTESVTTFCKKVLREYYFYTGLRPGFRVISDFEKRLLIKNIIESDIKLEYFKRSRSGEGLIKEAANFTDTAKRSPGWEKNINISGVPAETNLKYRDLQEIIKRYEKAKEKFNYLDFVDLTIHTRELIRKKPQIFSFNYVFIYEAEDMDTITSEIVIEILKNTENAVVSLDAETGIYQFRGAMPDNFKENLTNNFKFRERFFDIEKSKIKEYFLAAETRDEEADYIAHDISLRIKNGVRPEEIAIISRSVGDNVNILTDALRRKGVNYVVSGGIGFFRQREINEILSLLTCINEMEKTDDIHFYRTLKITGCISDDEVDILRKDALIRGHSLQTVFSENMSEKSREFWDKMKELKEISGEETVQHFIFRIMNDFGFLKKAAEDEFTARLYSYFYMVVKDFSEHYLRLKNEILYFSKFMDNLYDLLSGFGKDMDIPFVSDLEAVKILTVQQAKSEKFKIAYLADMTEENFPRPYFENPLLSAEDYRALGLKPVPGVIEQYEFEKKLFEVARTRAEEIIYSYFETETDGSPVEISSFINGFNIVPIKDKIKAAVIDEKDFFVNLVELVPLKEIEEYTERLEGSLKEKAKLILKAVNFEEQMLCDRVSKGIPASFSYTSISSFTECPEYFFLRHILKLNEPDTMHKMLGTAVHKILHKVHADDVTCEKEVSALVQEIWGELEFSSEFESRNLLILVNNILAEYFNLIENSDFEVLATEEDFNISLNGIQITGRYDRIDNYNGFERVVDYKTGKRVSAERGLLNEVKKGKNFQIPIYKWARDCDLFTVYRLRFPSEKMEVNIDFRDDKAGKILAEAEELLVNTVNEIKKGIYLPGESGRCRNCYFKRICRKT